MHIARAVSLCLLIGCAKEREPAPTEMEDLVRYMFRNWEDPDRMSKAKDNLSAWLIDIAGTEEGEKGLQLTRLETSDLEDISWPSDRGLEGILGVSGAGVSRHPVWLHAETQMLQDQVYLNPINYERYERKITAGDPAGFSTGTDLARSRNDIQTKSWGVKIPYTLYKDFRWVEGDGDDQTFISRSWIEERGCNEGGGNCLEVSFSIDVWFGQGDETLRMTAGWSEVTSSLSLGDDLLIAGLAGGYQNIFRKTDEYLDTYPSR